ncbi:MAG: ParB/RepB/Spo0J family partition protein [Cytophagales bacterium]|nr:ParB/RepB/Spo0J family partition protein [Cytophagales bacterium]
MNQQGKSNKRVLGKGLKALLEDSYSAAQDQQITPKYTNLPEQSTQVPLDNIEPNPQQPRKDFDENNLKELIQSVKLHGIIQPITVSALPNNRYQIISGERRWQAAKRANLKTIPVFLRKSKGDHDMLELALIENIQREDLNAVEVAISYQRLLKECQINQEDLALRIGKNRATIANYIRILKLPPEVQIAIRDKKISVGHAKVILSVNHPDQQSKLLKLILKEDLSVRSTEEKVKSYNPSKAKKISKKHKPQSDAIKSMQKRLSAHLATKVKLKIQKNEEGEINISFFSAEDLGRILEILRLPME